MSDLPSKLIMGYPHADYPHSTPRETTMSARSQVLTLLNKWGGSFEDYSSSKTQLMGVADAPKGFVWNATMCHTIAINFYSDRVAGWTALLEDIKNGLTECTESDCEMCESQCYCDNLDSLDGTECVYCAEEALNTTSELARQRRYQSRVSESTERAAIEPFEGKGPFEPPF